MSEPIDIDLRGLEHKFSTNGRQVCAVCGFDFDLREEDEDQKFPLMLWRNGGKEMLVLCLEPCAAMRMTRFSKRVEG